MNVIEKQLRIWKLRGEINTIKMKLEVPGQLARIEGWRETLLDQLAETEQELMRLES